MKPRVYLSGPISDLLYADAVAWRKEAAGMLEPYIDAFSPMRGKELLRNAGVINDAETAKHTNAFQLRPRGIVTRDRNDVRTCDMMLVYLPRTTKRVSIGTCVELGWADAWRKPIVTVLEKPSLYDHIFVTELSGWVVESLEEAVYVCMSVLLP